jgi:hypothetical protein
VTGVRSTVSPAVATSCPTYWPSGPLCRVFAVSVAVAVPPAGTTSWDRSSANVPDALPRGSHPETASFSVTGVVPTLR